MPTKIPHTNVQNMLLEIPTTEFVHTDLMAAEIDDAWDCIRTYTARVMAFWSKRSPCTELHTALSILDADKMWGRALPKNGTVSFDWCIKIITRQLGANIGLFEASLLHLQSWMLDRAPDKPEAITATQSENALGLSQAAW